MKRLKDSLKKINKGIDDSFLVTMNGRTFVNKTCSQGKMVTVDYFALYDLIKYFEETQEQSNRIMIARDMLQGVLFGSYPIDKEAVIDKVKKQSKV